MKKNPWILSILFSVVLISIFFLGVMIGQYTITQPIKKIIRASQKSETMGSFLTDNQKAGISLVYSDSEKIYDEMGDISWDVPKAFTPFVGIAPLPGTHNNAKINSMQFRSDQEVQLPKPSNVYRIIVTGGSTAFGSGAPDQEKTISAYLSALLNAQLLPTTDLHYEVLTFASPAWSTTHERIAIENRISELEPNLVISISGNNDVHWGWLGFNVLWFRTYSDDLFLSLINKAYELAGYPDLPDVTQIETNPISPSLVSRRLEKNVTISAYTLGLEKIPYIYFLQPTIARTNKPLTQRESQILSQAEKQYYIDCMQAFNSELSKLKIENFHYFDLSYIFDSLDQTQEIYIDRSHFGDKGYELIAKAIFASIREFIPH